MLVKIASVVTCQILELENIKKKIKIKQFLCFSTVCSNLKDKVLFRKVLVFCHNKILF